MVVSCDIKINVNIIQNCCRNLAVRGLRLLLLVGNIISVLVVFCIWQVLILAFLK